ncbi:MAG: transglycosylase domain-containing protein [Spirochaetes bacterium]|nr:transglycosylase domain-containing protein [Spirochaetota bacterium]MBU1080226.1 transglycosylase domain-containing protein [Spirochaetota bacterium]
MITILFDRAIRRSRLAFRLKHDSGSCLKKAPISALGRLTSRAAQACRRVAAVVAIAHLWFIGTTTLLVACFAFVDPAATTLSVYRKYVDGWKIERPVRTDLESVPRLARRMLVSVEDSKFWTHPGFDLEAFERAYEVNKRIGRPMYGGSTLTMQTARTLFLVPFKSYARKYLELIVAIELEALLPKERILELYFGWAEWGKGVFGIEAAARLYYGAPVSKLSPDKTARLMAVLSSPIRFTPKTLAKSALLSSRYEFLAARYVR